MSTLISTALLRRAQTALPPELAACALHTSSPCLAKPRRPRYTSRFAKNLTSNAKEEEPPPPPFVRDEVPHTEAEDRFVAHEEAQQRRNRQHRARMAKKDFGSGTWNVAKKSEPPPSRQTRYTPNPGRSTPDSGSSTSKPNFHASKSAASTRAAAKRDDDGDTPLSGYGRPKDADTLVSDDFERSVHPEPIKSLPSEFTSPPLMPGLLDSVVAVLGPHAQPTAIQGLALKHVLYPWKTKADAQALRWREFLLASETGSGKSLAYMLPMLQDLKASELAAAAEEEAAGDPKDSNRRAYNPRAILASTAKALLHNIKLRVLCASRANAPSTTARQLTAAKMAALFDGADGDGALGARRHGHPVDVLIGTTGKILEMVRGHGWNWDVRSENEKPEDVWEVDEKGRKVRRRKFVVGQPEVGLHRVEWVVIDEADVLFDPDFRDQTLLLLSDIARARGVPVPQEPQSPSTPTPADAPPPTPYQYPFNLILTSATIPASLARHLSTHHPRLARLVSPRLHRLPAALRTEHAAWTGGNRNADVEARIRRIWWADAHAHQGDSRAKSKVLVFCNKSAKVDELGRYLEAHGIPNVALTSTAAARGRGNNRHLDGFVRVPGALGREQAAATATATAAQDHGEEAHGASSGSGSAEEDPEAPHVLITTSLLSRGLDFAPDVQHVLIVDAPRNMVDFLHRAGRTARAGERGTVVVFGKAKGRGAERTREMRRRVGELRMR